MLIPRHWYRFDSEAQRLAAEAVERIAARIRRGEGFPERYAYGERPLREEIVQELPSAGAGEPDAAITRNSYGALVLNTGHVHPAVEPLVQIHDRHTRADSGLPLA